MNVDQNKLWILRGFTYQRRVELEDGDDNHDKRLRWYAGASNSCFDRETSETTKTVGGDALGDLNW